MLNLARLRDGRLAALNCRARAAVLRRDGLQQCRRAALDFYLTSDTFACDLALNGETSVGRVQLGGDGSGVSRT